MISTQVELHTGDHLLWDLDKEQFQLENLIKIRDRVKAAGVKEKYLRYEQLDSNHSLLDQARTWLLGDLSRDPRCKTPRDGRTTLKIHTGAVSEHGMLFVDTANVARTVVELKKDDKAARRMAIEARNVHENHLCPSCLLEHWTYVLTKYNSRFGLRFLDLPATLALLDAKARGEVAVGV